MPLTRLLLLMAMLSTALSAAYAKPSKPPIPRPKPSVQSETSGQPSPSTNEKKSTAVQIATDDGMSQADCKAAMEAVGATFAWIGETELEGCTVEQGVELVSVRSNGSQIAFPQKPTMSCKFAERFAQWTAEIAGPVVVGHTGVQLQAIVTGPGLVCRNRVGTSTTKVSEHAKGNAIDIAGFTLAGIIDGNVTLDMDIAEAALELAPADGSSASLPADAPATAPGSYDYLSMMGWMSGFWQVGMPW